jgi:hypothetical protein
MSKEPKYHKLTVEGDKKTQWICGCFETIDGYFWFCDEHKNTLNKTIDICDVIHDYSEPLIYFKQLV